MIVSRGPWNLDDTRRMVRALHGEEQEALISPCLESLVARQFYAGYHMANFERVVVDRLTTAPEGWTPERLVMLANDAKTAEEHRQLHARLAAEATACASALHGLLDTLAHAVAYSRGMNLGQGALPERQISLSAVKKRLSTQGEAQAVALAFGTIDRSDDVRYLDALVNHSKHRSVIRPSFYFDARSDLPSFSIEFERFPFGLDKNAKPDAEDKRMWHERREVKSALEKAHGAISHWIVEVGLRINDHLALEVAAA